MGVRTVVIEQCDIVEYIHELWSLSSKRLGVKAH